MATKPKTNVQLVTHMMDYSAVGAIKQAFIIEAIREYAKQQLAAGPWSEASFIPQASWKTAAQECLDSINNRSV